MKLGGTLLLVAPLAHEIPSELAQRAVHVADKLGLTVVAYCPVTSARPEQAQADGVDAASLKQTRALADRHVASIAETIEARGVPAVWRTETCISPLDGIVELAAEIDAVIVMMSAGDYLEWTNLPLTNGGQLENCDTPIWVQNDAVPDGLVLGALDVEADGSRQHQQYLIGSLARRIATRLGRELHVLNSIASPRSAAKTLASTVPGDRAAEANRRIESEHVAGLHKLVEACGIPESHAHLNDKNLLEALEEFSDSRPLSLIVMGATERSRLMRMLTESKHHRMITDLRADLLIVGEHVDGERLT